MRFPLILSLLATAGYAQAEIQFYLGSGVQSVLESDVIIDYVDGRERELHVPWEGRSNIRPPLWMVRGTQWLDNDYGWGIQVTHNKAYAGSDFKLENNIETLEFTDGLNTFMATGSKRWVDERFTTYIGGGVGLNFPHVEYREDILDELVAEFQITGISAGAFAGIEYAISDHWSVYNELGVQGSQINADIGGYGNLSTSLVTPAIFLGLSYRF